MCYYRVISQSLNSLLLHKNCHFWKCKCTPAIVVHWIGMHILCVISVRAVPGTAQGWLTCRWWFPRSSASRPLWSSSGAWGATGSLHGIKELNQTEINICSSSRLQRLLAHAAPLRVLLVIQKRRTTSASGLILEREYKGYPTLTSLISTALAAHKLNRE